MPSKSGKAQLSPGGELLLGIILIPVAIIFLWSNLGYVVMGIVSWIGVVVVGHALWRIVRRPDKRRRIGTGTMLVLVVLLSGAAWLSFPTSGHAAVAGSVHGGGQWNAPTPNKCRTGSGWTEGTYPSLNIDLSGGTISWRKTYKFSMDIKVCVKTTDPLGLNRVFRFWHISHLKFSDLDWAIIQNPHYDRTEAVWDPEKPGCLNIRVKGYATLTPLPIPGLDKIFPIVSTATIHFWVDFNDVCTDGSVGEVKPDDYPY
jgi:hypothetical protein